MDPRVCKYTSPSGRNKTVSVIPTRSVDAQPFAGRQNMFLELGDVIAVEHSGEDFCFARSMNLGINRALMDGYHLVVLSNDDVSWYAPGRMHEMIDYLASNDGVDFVAPYVNSYRQTGDVTTSLWKYFLHQVTRNKAPFWAWRQKTRIETIASQAGIPNPWMFIYHPKGFVGVQPFSVFKARVLEKVRFDESFINQMEDTEMAYRLFLQGYRGETNPRWSILHDRHYSFDRNTSVKIPFEANLIRLWKKYPVVVRYKDHQPPPNHHHEPGMTSSRD